MLKAAWTNLAVSSQPTQHADADVCIVGAGAAGAYLATQLARKGRHVVLLEAGPLVCTDLTGINFQVFFESGPYAGATAGRFFGMGGSTSSWGGLLVPYTSHDIPAGGRFREEWSHIVGVTQKFMPEVLRQLRYRGPCDFETYGNSVLEEVGRHLSKVGLNVQSSLYLPFSKKNLVTLLRNVRDDRARVFFNSVAKEWEIREGRSEGVSINGVTAVSKSGNEVKVTAKHFVLAAGAIESARILLELNESRRFPVLPPRAAIGHFLGDHLSLPIADVVPSDRESAVRLFGPRFQGKWMRGFRMVLADRPGDLPNGFAHFIFENPTIGFELAKAILGAIQRRRIPRINILDGIRAIDDLARLAWHRFVKSRLFIPDDAPIRLQMDMEQQDTGGNRVVLTEERDVYGRRIPRIRWQVSERDFENGAELMRIFLARWPGSQAGVPDLLPRDYVVEGEKPHDAYHPVGVCRMGADDEAVVGWDLKVRGTDNLWLVSTGLLPSAGAANPTFSVLCLAHALSCQLDSVLS